MVLQRNVQAKPLPVSTIDLERSGRANVTFRASVTDTEHYYFTVPKSSMQTAVESLEVHDTRGGTPCVTFPAPLVPRVNPMVLKKTSTFYDLLKRHQGAHVELNTHTGKVEGNFIGFQHQGHHMDPWIVLKTDGNICMYAPNTISAIAFKGVEVAKKLDRYTSTLCRVQEEDSVYRINIAATGIGDGEVCVSYTAWSYFSPTFDFCYSMYAEDDTDANVKNEEARQGPTVRSKVRVKCYAVIRNPLHYDLNDVHFTLHTGRHRFPQRAIYRAIDEQVDEHPRSKSSSPIRRRRRVWSRTGGSSSKSRSPSRSQSPSPKSKSPERSPSPHSPSKSASRHGVSETSSGKTSDPRSLRLVAATSEYAHYLDPSRELDVPDSVCIKEGESVKVLLYETQIEGGVGHHCSYKGRQGRAVILSNITDRVLEPGLATFFEKKLPREMNVPCIKPGEDQCFHIDKSGCDVKKIRSERRGEVLWSRIVGKSLVSNVMWYRKQKYITYNKEDEQIDVLVDYVSGERTGREVQLSARFYPKVSRTGDPEDEDSGVELERYSEKGFQNIVSYKVRVAPKQRCAVVVNETEAKLEILPILLYSREQIPVLEELKVIGPALAEKLKRLVDTRRKIDRLRRKRTLHRSRLEHIKESEQGLVKLTTQKEGNDEEDENKRYFAGVNAAEDSMAEIEDAVDEIECQLVKLMGQLKVATEDICDMDHVDLGDEGDGNVPETVI